MAKIVTLYKKYGEAVEIALDSKTAEKFERRWRRAHHRTLKGSLLAIEGANGVIWKERILDIPKKYHAFFVTS